MRFLFGVLIGVAGVFVAGYFIATSGRISVAATQHGGINDRIDSFLASVSDKSIEKHAPRKSNPFANDPAAAASGLIHYRANCLSCHGAKDIDTAEFAKGLNPGAPMLDMKDSQKLSDGELFWVISNGIRSTGMPAFSQTHNPDEIWRIVSFVRRLPQLTPEEIAKLKEGRPEADHHHEEAGH
jgi:mono/diheme cytochrome c family protein